MSLMMLHLPVSARALFATGRDHGLVRDGWSVDTGYLVHALFARLFGAEAPKPFDVQETKAGASGELAVLAYAASDHRSLAARAAAADGGAAGAIAWDRAGSKPMPVFEEGQRLRFRLRVCPVVRVGRQHARFAPGAEVDPYLALVQQRLASAGPFPTDAAEQACRQAIIAELPAREAVYEDWLAARIGEAAALRTARMVAQRDARLWRRGEPGPEAASRMHGRARAGQGARRVIGRREAVFEGELAVGDPAAFSALLARGVGRHRAFGFGMLLLRPPAGG